MNEERLLPRGFWTYDNDEKKALVKILESWKTRFTCREFLKESKRTSRKESLFLCFAEKAVTTPSGTLDLVFINDMTECFTFPFNLFTTKTGSFDFTKLMRVKELDPSLLLSMEREVLYEGYGNESIEAICEQLEKTATAQEKKRIEKNIETLNQIALNAFPFNPNHTEGK